MAKPRKPKVDEAKPGSSGAVIRHQKLCLSIDIEKQQIYGYTELEIVVPEIGIVGLFAENLGIENVFVDGEPTEFEYYPRQHEGRGGPRWLSSVTCRNSAADVAGSAYVAALDRELVPNLLINCCKGFRNGVSEPQENVAAENGVQNSGEDKQNVKLVRINYWVEKAETGIHFSGNVLHTDNQIRRARCWFPCIDEGSQCCRYDLEFTVAHNLVAVSAGSLLHQVLSKDSPRKTYVYRLDVPVTSRWIALVVAPFEILPDPYLGLITHICLPAYTSMVRNTVEFFHNAFNHYEEYLDAKFPFGSYTLVFLPPEMVASSLSLGASISIFSSQVLYDERVIDQAIDTSVKLAFALAKQWFGVYITAEEPNDEWLLDGLAGFLTDLFIKRFLGNNEARYRRYKANCAVCKADDSGATALSSAASCKDLYGTHCMGLYGKIRSWKSVAILQMLEKQMGPESFRKILQKVVSRAGDVNPVRTLSTKEFRHFTTKVGNLERPFVKEFFPRWVCSCGCPILRMGFSYNKKKNMVELAVLRECTATPEASALVQNPDSENRDGDGGWPGMMSIRVYELDGMYDHPVLPLAGDMWQLLEIQCHTKLAARRFQKPKKGSKLDGSEENGDVVPATDMRSSLESPLSWVRADPEMEYLAEIHFNQPVQMWINQLEKDEDVVAQAQAIAALEALPQLSFSVVNALNNFLSDSKAFWRVRIEAAFALANTASEETDWAGLLHLVKFYKNRRFDATIGLPKPNDFHDFPEYFVLEAIPHAVAMVRAADRRSPREAVEFVLQLLKYNDNTGNPYSDVFWLAALVQSVGELEFGPQSVLFLSSLLKRIDRLLQFDRLMPSYNGILTVSCIRTLAQIAIKLSGSVHIDHVCELIKPFRDIKTIWQVRIEASRALLDLEFHCRGIDAALSLFIKYLTDEPSLRGQVKLGAHAMRFCQLRDGSGLNDDIQNSTLVALLHLLDGNIAFNNVFLRHQLFCIFQILAARPPTLYGVPREKSLHVSDAETFEPKNIFATPAPVMDIHPVEPPVPIPISPQNIFVVPEIPKEPDTVFNNDEHRIDLTALENNKEIEIIPINFEQKVDLNAPEVSKEADTVSNNQERKKPVVKIRVRQSAASSRAEEADNQTLERSQGRPYETDRGATSSVSVDAPQRNSAAEAVSISNQNLDEVSSGLDRGSRMTASIGSAKLASDDDNIRKELHCTADSSVVSAHLQPESEHPSSFAGVPEDNNVDADAQKFTSLQSLAIGKVDAEGSSLGTVASSFNEKDKEKKKKKEKEKKKNKEDRKRHRDDPEYLERKRLKKEKKRKEKELAKLLSDETKLPAGGETSSKKEEPGTKMATAASKPDEPSRLKPDVEPKPERGESVGASTNIVKSKPQAAQGSSVPRFRIKIKSKTLNKS